MIDRYKVIRFYRDKDKPNKTVRRGLTLEQAQAHCDDPRNRKEGVWFDGYTKED